jgi:hypothetical protein
MTTKTDETRYTPVCSCGWVGRDRKDKTAAESTGERHTWRCPDSSQRVNIEMSFSAAGRRNRW